MLKSSSSDNIENSDPLSVVIVLKIVSQCSLYRERMVVKAAMTPFGFRPGTRIIQYSRVLRSSIVSRASSSFFFEPMTRSASQCPNSLLSFASDGRSSMLRPRTLLFLRVFTLFEDLRSFSGGWIFLMSSSPRLA